MAEASPEEIQELASRYEVLQRELARLDQRLGALEEGVVEARRAESTLRGLLEREGEQEVLVPIGGGVYLRARVDPSAPLIRPVGAGYATEGGLADAAARMQERAADAQKQYDAARQEAQRVAQAAQETADRLQAHSAGMV